MTASDDGPERFEAMLNAISKITSGDEGLIGARCPKCGASSFVKVSDLFDDARGRLEEQGSASSDVREGGLTDLQIVETFRPPQRRSAIGRVIAVAVPLFVVAFYLYRRFGATVGQISTATALIATMIVLMTSLRRLSDEYYDRRHRWNSLYMCRRCGEVVAS
jgi:DNA-directed RNA polymerase subunit RPC12/RpoP